LNFWITWELAVTQPQRNLGARILDSVSILIRVSRRGKMTEPEQDARQWSWDIHLRKYLGRGNSMRHLQ
jgi:hypothetical protein